MPPPLFTKAVFIGKRLMKKQIVVASNNAHKLQEIAEIFTEYEIISQRQAGFSEDV